MKKITVLGDGAWGSAIAHTLAQKNAVTLWCYDTDVAESIQTIHENKKYLPEVPLNHRIHVTTSLEEALKSSIIFEAIPVSFLRTTLLHCTPFIQPAQSWIALSKGIEQETFAVSSDIIQETTQSTIIHVLSGPTYARDLALGQPSGFTVSGPDNYTQEIIDLFPEYCAFDYSADIRGVQLYGALKNVLALATGIIEGAGYTDNLKTLCFTRIFNEIKNICIKLEAKQETVFSCAALGDSILTSFGKESKNQKLGTLIGSGKTMSEALKYYFSTAPESVNTIESAYKLIQIHSIAAPCITMLYAFIHGKKTIQEFVQCLLHSTAP